MSEHTSESPWDAKNPETLAALVIDHSEDYCEDVDFSPFLAQWRADRAVRAALRERLAGLEKSWLVLLREIAKLDNETDWDGADDDTFLEQFDPWHLLRRASALRGKEASDGRDA